MNELTILKELGFKKTNSEFVESGLYKNSWVDVYINNTHTIRHWKTTNEFSCTQNSTTITTMIIDFAGVMEFYFKNIGRYGKMGTNS